MCTHVYIMYIQFLYTYRPYIYMYIQVYTCIYTYIQRTNYVCTSQYMYISCIQMIYH